MHQNELEAALLDIYGIGPTSVKNIAKRVRQINPNVSSRNLRETLARVSGLSALTLSDLKYNPVKTIPRKIIDHIRKEYAVEVAGSYRRGLPFSRDIDVITDKPREYWSKFREITEPVVWGTRKMLCYILIEKQYYKVDFYFAGNGALLLYLTGSKPFNIFMRIRAQRMGMKLTADGLYKNGECIASKKEEDIFTALDMPYIEPKDRTGWLHTNQLDAIRLHSQSHPRRR